MILLSGAKVKCLLAILEGIYGGFFYSDYIYTGIFAETNELPHRCMVSWVVAQKNRKRKN